MINEPPFTIVKDMRNETLFMMYCPLDKLSTIYNGAKTKYERLALDFIQTIQKNASSAIYLYRSDDG